MAKPLVDKNKAVKKKQAAPVSKKQQQKHAEVNWQLWAGLGVILIATFIAYFGITKNQLTNWDDPTYITNNPLIKSLSAANIKRIFTETYFANYQPIQIFSYAVEYHFFGLDAAGYHWVSLIQHLINTALVLWLAYAVSGNKWISFVTALLFGIHPMHVESVAWAAERKDLLYSMFLFASLIAYVKYVKGNLTFTLYVVSLLLFVLSIFSKTMAVSLIPVLFLADWYLGRKIDLRAILEKLPFVIVAGIMGYIAARNAAKTGSIDVDTFYSQIDRVFFGCQNLLMYVIKLIFPFQLSGYYQYPDIVNGGIPNSYYISAVIILLLAVAVFYSLKFTKHVVFAGGFFVASVILVLQILPVGPTLFSERYSYIPSVGLNLLIGIGMVNLMNKYNNSNTVKFLIYGGTAVYSIWLIAYTRERCAVWKDSISFWTDVIKGNPKIPVAYNNRGNEYKTLEKFDLAMPDLNKAIELKNDYMEPYAILGDIYRQQGKYDLAMTNLNKAIQLKPKAENALVNRGIVYAILNKTDSAMMDFTRSIELKPEMFEAYGNRGNLNAMLQHREAAIADYNKALSINPDFKDAYRNLGLLSTETGKFDEAINYFNKYIEVAGRETNRVMSPQIYFDIAQAYSHKNDFANAVRYADVARSNGFAVNEGLVQQWREMVK
ncbi:MAG: tetratricopeptide repeat protein [Bacteroidia bacterium]